MAHSNASAHARIHVSTSEFDRQFMTITNNPRFKQFEPVMRRLVLTMIIAFLMVAALGAGLVTSNSRNAAIQNAKDDIALIAAAVDDDFQHRATPQQLELSVQLQTVIDLHAPKAARTHDRFVIVTDHKGQIIAASKAYAGHIGQPLANLVQSDPSGNGDAITLSNGMKVIGAMRPLETPLGRFLVAQPVTTALAQWKRETMLIWILFATTGLFLLLIGVAYHTQYMSTRAADLHNAKVTATMDTALERGRCGVWDWDLDRGRIYWSSSMRDMLGLDPDRLRLNGETLADLVHPCDMDLATAAQDILTGTSDAIDHEFRLRHAHGHWIWVRVRGKKIIDSGDRSPHIVGIAIDISEQRAADDANTTMHRRVAEAIEIISEAFVIWDADNRLVTCNTKFRQLHGIPDDMAIPGTSSQNLLAMASAPKATISSMTQNLRDGTKSYEMHLDDGRWLHFNQRRTQCGGSVLVGADITGLKQHEEAMQQSEQQLLKTVADLRSSQLTLEVQAQQLAELAEKYAEEKNRAEDANQAKSAFLANMSHELRTPLNAIIGFSQVMSSEMFGPVGHEKYRDYCRDIGESGQFLLSLINDILDMSKIEAGRFRIDETDVPMDDIAEETLRIVSVMAAAKNLSVTTDISPGLAVRADRRALKQVLINLLSNAVKFTPQGGDITIKARGRGNGVTISIDDTGIGIPAKAMRKICQPFEQVESQMTRSHGGSGLGLAIASSLTRLQGGALRIRSVEGKGTTVIVRLNRARTSQVAVAA